MNLKKCAEVLEHVMTMRGSGDMIEYCIEDVNQICANRLKKYRMLGLDGDKELMADSSWKKEVGEFVLKMAIVGRVGIYQVLSDELLGISIKIRVKHIIIQSYINYRRLSNSPDDTIGSSPMGLDIECTLTKGIISETCRFHVDIDDIFVEYYNGVMYVSNITCMELDSIILRFIYTGLKNKLKTTERNAMVIALTHKVFGGTEKYAKQMVDLIPNKGNLGNKCYEGINSMEDAYRRIM